MDVCTVRFGDVRSELSVAPSQPCAVDEGCVIMRESAFLCKTCCLTWPPGHQLMRSHQSVRPSPT
jgi:hypothetical protein